MKELVENICNFFIEKSSFFIRLIKVCYLALILFVGIVLSSPFHGKVGNFFGELSVLFYVATLLPGMAMRLGVHHTFFTLIRVYRRHIGIAMYLFALSHVVLNKFPDLIPDFSKTPTFELMGIVAIIIFLFLFITSNNFSQKLLGIGWVYLHRLTYVGMFFILLHLSILKSSTWGVLMWVVVLFQLTSFYIYARRQSSKTSTNPPLQSPQ
jgi:DMSO/TMAO reductase YedYZ heme-binding membrane subunit